MSEVKPQVKYRKDYQPFPFTVTALDLDFHLFDDKTIVKSKMTLQAKQQTAEQHQALQLDGEGLKLLTVKLNQKQLTAEDYQLSAEQLIINHMPETASLEIEVEIDPANNTALEGLYISNGKFCTQCEAEGFRRITYFPDRPDVLTIFTTRIEADKNKYPALLSNGNAVDRGEADNGRHWVKWHDPFAKPCYLFALVAGDFDLTTGSFTTKSGREVALEIYSDRGTADRCIYALESLKRSMQWDEERFNLQYDLDIYMIVAVGDFNMGAMENKGLNVFNTKYVLASDKTATDKEFEYVEAVIGHEYFHNWTGNRVTCQDWFQLSLKEGLTVFRDQEFTSDLHNRTVKRIQDVQIIRSNQFAEDSGPMAHPIRPDAYIEMNNFYTVTVYNKGAEIIRMIHTLLGEENFQKGMALYFARHDGCAVTCEDFVVAMEDASGIDLQQFRLWYSQAGTPELHITEKYDDAHYSLTIKQSCPDTPGQKNKQPFFIPLKLGLIANNGYEFDWQCGDYSSADEGFIVVSEAEQTFEFGLIESKPILSLLRDFSAPVKIHYAYQDKDLCFLLAHDSNSFARWDAGQQLLTNLIKKLHQDKLTGQDLLVPQYIVDAFHRVVDDVSIDGLMKAELLQVPSLNTLIECFDRVDMDALNEVHAFVIHTLASELKASFVQLYENNQVKQDDETIVQENKRAVRNVALKFLTSLKTEDVLQLAKQQFDQANNMTEQIAAFACLQETESTQRLEVVAAFEQQWQDDALVMDKWFACQAQANVATVLDRVNALLQHDKFTYKNPNRVRALINSFSHVNPAQFHRKDGKGYQWLAEQIIKLYSINPQVASRLTGAFNRWKKFDDARQGLMKTELQRILAVPDLCRDVYEIASKALDA